MQQISEPGSANHPVPRRTQTACTSTVPVLQPGHSHSARWACLLRFVLAFAILVRYQKAIPFLSFFFFFLTETTLSRQSSSTKFKFSGGKPIKTSSMNTFSPSTGSPSSPFPRPNQTPPPSNLFQLRALVHNGIAVHQRQMDAFVNLSQLLTSLQRN